MKEYTNIIEKLLKESSIPPAPEAILTLLLETYLTESTSRYSNRHHTEVATRMLTLLKDYENKAVKEVDDAKQLKLALANQISNIPIIRFDKKGSFANVIKAFYIFYPNYNLVVEQVLKVHLSLIEIPFNPTHIAKSMLAAVESKRFSEMTIPGITSRWRNFWKRVDDAAPFYKLDIAAKTFARVFSLLPDDVKKVFLKRLISYLSSSREKLKSFSAQVLHIVLPSLPVVLKNYAMEKITENLNSFRSIRDEGDIIVLLALFPSLDMELRKTCLKKIDLTGEENFKIIRNKIPENDKNMMNHYLVECLPLLDTLADSDINNTFINFIHHLNCDLLVSSEYGSERCDNVAFHNLLAVFPRIQNARVKDEMSKALAKSFVINNLSVIYKMQIESDVIYIEMNSFENIFSEQLGKLFASFEINDLLYSTPHKARFLPAIRTLNQYPDLAGDFVAKKNILDQLMTCIATKPYKISIDALNYIQNLKDFIMNADEDHARYLSGLDGVPITTELPSVTIMNFLLQHLQPEPTQIVSKLATRSLIYNKICVMLNEMRDLIPASHKYKFSIALLNLLSVSENFFPTEETSEALKQLAVIFPQIIPHHDLLDQKLTANKRKNAFRQAKLLFETKELNFAVGDQQEVKISEIISYMKTRCYRGGITRFDVDLCITGLKLVLPYIDSDQYPLLISILAYRIAHKLPSDKVEAITAKNLLKAIISSQSLEENLSLAKQTIPHFSSNSVNFFPKEPMVLLGVLTDVLADKKESALLQTYFVIAYLNYLKNKSSYYNDAVRDQVLGVSLIDPYYDKVNNILVRHEQTAASENVCYLINRMISHQFLLTIKSSKLHGDGIDHLDIIAQYTVSPALTESDYSEVTDRRRLIL